MDDQLTSKAQQALKTKKAILDKSLVLFVEKGYKNVTTSDILKATGLSKGGFYHHFESKEALFQHLVDSFLLSILEVPYETFNKQSLYSFYLDYIAYVSGDDLDSDFSPNSINFASLIYDAIQLIPNFEERLSAIKHSEEEAWKRVVEQAKDKDEIKSSMSNEMISKLFMTSYKGIHYEQTLDKHEKDFKTQLLELWGEIYKSLK